MHFMPEFTANSSWLLLLLHTPGVCCVGDAELKSCSNVLHTC
jgi:hypothetical protein